VLHSFRLKRYWWWMMVLRFVLSLLRGNLNGSIWMLILHNFKRLHLHTAHAWLPGSRNFVLFYIIHRWLEWTRIHFVVFILVWSRFFNFIIGELHSFALLFKHIFELFEPVIVIDPSLDHFFSRSADQAFFAFLLVSYQVIKIVGITTSV
jgi:hypothetical protein